MSNACNGSTPDFILFVALYDIRDERVFSQVLDWRQVNIKVGFYANDIWNTNLVSLGASDRKCVTAHMMKGLRQI